MEAFRSYMAFAQTDSNIPDISEEENHSQSQKPETRPEEEENSDGYETEGAPLDSDVTSLQRNDTTPLTPATTTSTSIPIASTSVTTPSQSLASNQKRQRRLQSGSNSSSVEAVVNYFENKRQRTEMTANDLIFSGYSKTVSSFSLKRQAIIKMKIAQIIMEEELKHSEELESSLRPSTSTFRSSTITPLSTPSPCSDVNASETLCNLDSNQRELSHEGTDTSLSAYLQNFTHFPSYSRYDNNM